MFQDLINAGVVVQYASNTLHIKSPGKDLAVCLQCRWELIVTFMIAETRFEVGQIMQCRQRCHSPVVSMGIQ